MEPIQDNYKQYRLLSEKEKLRRIKDAKQSEKDRRENPQGNIVFDEVNWLPFQVYQGPHLIKLATYRMLQSKEHKEPRAVIVMFHGLNSHLGHGAHIAKALSEVGIITVGFDHRGFGKSEGKPGYVESLESHLHDSKTFVGKVKDVYPELPMFSTGLSMGGMTAYFLSLRHQEMFKGAILMAPAIKNITGGFLVNVVLGLANILPKSFRLIKPPRGQATRNPKVTEDIVKDEFAFSDRASLKSVQTLVHTMDVAPETYDKFDIPFVIVQGGLDKLVNPIGAFELYDKSPSKDKQIWFYEEMWHDVWHQQEIYEIIDRMKQWLADHLPQPSRQ